MLYNLKKKLSFFEDRFFIFQIFVILITKIDWASAERDKRVSLSVCTIFGLVKLKMARFPPAWSKRVSAPGLHCLRLKK